MNKTNLIVERNKVVLASTKNDISTCLVNLNHLILNSKIVVKLASKLITIYPLWIESYYYNEKQNWLDQAVHSERGKGGVEEQRGHELTLYFHRKGRNGVDLVLSNDKNYALSFLIKNCVLEIDGKKFNCSETELENKINKIAQAIDPNIILKKQKEVRHIFNVNIYDHLISDDFCIFDTKRVGIDCEDKVWNRIKLASFVFNLKNFYHKQYRKILAKKLLRYYK